MGQCGWKGISEGKLVGPSNDNNPDTILTGRESGCSVRSPSNKSPRSTARGGCRINGRLAERYFN